MPRFAFNIYDPETGKLLGGVCYDDGVHSDSEVAWEATVAEWDERHGDVVHIEEISPEEWDRSLGKPWPNGL